MERDSISSRKPELMENSTVDYDIVFKVIVVGDSNVGKTCISMKASKDEFKKTYYATVAFEFCNLAYRIEDKVIKLQIWDTCGQEIYKSLIANFYKSSSLAIAVFSIDKCLFKKSRKFPFDRRVAEEHKDALQAQL